MIDRLFCLLLGHTWQEAPPKGKGVWYCAHCPSRVCDVQLLDPAKDTLSAFHTLREQGPPKRRWAL